MRIIPICLAAILSACAASDGGSNQNRIVSETGGETIALVNGVCIITRTDNDEDFSYIIPRSRCDG